MKKLILLFLLLIVFCKNRENTNVINIDLKNELEDILTKDQGLRELTSNNLTEKRKQELFQKLNISEINVEGNKLYDLINFTDSINLIKVEKIINKYGYPSKLIVGEPANKAVFYVIQHSLKIDKYLPIIRKAVEQGDINKSSLAMMEDRNLMYKGKEQIYGTQIKGKENKKGEWIYFLWPLKNADSINVWRRRVGLEQTIQDYVKEMEVEYKLYKIEDLDKI